MKGRNKFSEAEINEIRSLISQKVDAPSGKQKALRKKIRAIGFYYSDFRENRITGGYSINDFNEIVDSGEITIV